MPTRHKTTIATGIARGLGDTIIVRKTGKSNLCSCIEYEAVIHDSATHYIQEMAAYFHRDVSTFSRQIGQIDASVRSRKGELPKLNQYIKSLTQA